jgi:hypothetical protein
MGVTPLPPGPVEFDDDGNPLPQPAPASDLADLIQLLEYGRLKGFKIGPTIRVGKIVTTVRDLRQRDQQTAKDDTPEPSIWEEHGYKPSE